jgi:DNA-binding CsgD family transcriptional regulator
MGRRPVWSRTLSPREQEVVRWLTAGFSRAGIARRLRISEETVKQHLKAVYRKLGVSDRYQVAALTARSDGGSRASTAGTARPPGGPSGPTAGSARSGERRPAVRTAQAV